MTPVPGAAITALPGALRPRGFAHGWLDQTGWPALAMAAAFATLFALSLYILGGMAPAELLAPGALVSSLLGLLALKSGGVVLRRSLAASRGLLDSATGLYSQSGFARESAVLLERARRSGRTLSVVVFEFDDLLEVHSIYGAAVSRTLLGQVARQLEAVAGGYGVAARTGRTQFSLALPGLNRDQARAAVESVFGQACCIEFDADDDEIMLVPEVLVDAMPDEAGSVTAFQQQLVADLARLRAEEQRRVLYLQRERESHSRPMSLAAH
ncbi:diguanylate cyclase [uncultured Ramlibacter sp.]|uniref:GGDEF domain-containing protein n=1 Tax=uncultured Ramlibacter sp. TaxID=260755 RepID=UPI00261B6CB0|nr:diguanylate cyclase [uncultured Ramlibacter sp.]